MRTLPPEVAKLAPKREDFTTEEDYQEAKAHFLHRVRHLAVPSHSPASRPA
jgi:hypothetical protein